MSSHHLPSFPALRSGAARFDLGTPLGDLETALRLRSVQKMRAALVRCQGSGLGDEQATHWEEAQAHAIHTCVSLRHAELLQGALDSGVNVDAVDHSNADRRVTALYKLCALGSSNTMSDEIGLILLDAGAQVTGYYPNSSKTLLIAAVATGLTRVTERLLSMGVDVNAPGDFCNSALHHAVCVTGPSPIPLLLLRHGAHVDALNSNRHTPLFVAEQLATSPEPFPDHVLALMAAGARPDPQTIAFSGFKDLLLLTPLQASIRVGASWLIEKNIESDLAPSTLPERLREACLLAEAAGATRQAHLARALYASIVSRQAVQELAGTTLSTPGFSEKIDNLGMKNSRWRTP